VKISSFSLAAAVIFQMSHSPFSLSETYPQEKSNAVALSKAVKTLGTFLLPKSMAK
jgi:hypothetical protein